MLLDPARLLDVDKPETKAVLGSVYLVVSKYGKSWGKSHSVLADSIAETRPSVSFLHASLPAGVSISAVAFFRESD